MLQLTLGKDVKYVAIIDLHLAIKAGVKMGKTKPVAASECFKFKPTDNQASGVKHGEQ